MTKSAARSYPVLDTCVLSGKVKTLIDMCDRDPVLTHRIVAKLRCRLPYLAATAATTTKDDKAQKSQRPVIPLQLVVPYQMTTPLAQQVPATQETNCLADGEEMSLVFSGLPVQWEAADVIDALRQSDIRGIAGLQMIKPGIAVVQVKSSQLATRCLALHGTCLRHPSGSWPIVVELLPMPNSTAPCVQTEPEAWNQPEVQAQPSPAQPSLTRPPLAPPFDLALCDDAKSRGRATGSHRKAAGSKSRDPVKEVAQADIENVDTYHGAEEQIHKNLLNTLLLKDHLSADNTDEVAQTMLQKFLNESSGEGFIV